MSRLKYIKVANKIQIAIEKGIYKEKLPSFSKLQSELGISQATLSMALNEVEANGYIIRKKRQGVFIKKHRTGKKVADVVNLILPKVEGNVFSETIQAAYDELNGFGYRLNLLITPTNAKDEYDQIVNCMNDDSKGVLILPVHESCKTISLLEELIKVKPLVQVDREFRGLDADFIAVDSYQGSKCATQQFIKKGYSEVGMLHYPQNELEALKRFKAYVDALVENGIRPSESWQIPVYLGKKSKMLEIVEKLFSETKVRAFVATNNTLARCFINIALELGYKAAEDYELIGFDVKETVEHFVPTIAYYEQPMKQVLAQAVSILDDRIKGIKGPSKRILIPAAFVPGETFHCKASVIK